MSETRPTPVKKTWRPPAVKTWRPSPLVLVGLLSMAQFPAEAGDSHHRQLRLGHRTGARPSAPKATPPKLWSPIASITAGTGPALPDLCTGDSKCMFWCYYTPTCTLSCFDNTGAAWSGTVNQGAGATCVGTPFASPRNLAQRDIQDATAPSVDSTALRAISTGNYTLLMISTATQQSDSSVGYLWSMNGGSFRMRNNSGNLEVLDTAQLATVGGSIWDSWVVASSRLSSFDGGTGVMTVRANGINGTPLGGAGGTGFSTALTLGARPAGTLPMRGDLAAFYVFTETKTDAYMTTAERKVGGVNGQKASAALHLPTGNQCLTGDAGFVDCFGAGLGITYGNALTTSQGFRNRFAADMHKSIDGGTYTGTGVTVLGVAMGPGSRVRNQPTAGELVDTDGTNFYCLNSAELVASCNNGWCNCSVFAQNGDAGLAVSNKLTISWATDGRVDGGTASQTFTTTSSWARYFTAFFPSGATTNKCKICAGAVGSDLASIDIDWPQSGNTMTPERPVLDNVNHSADWGVVDGTNAPSGCSSGKIEQEFMVPWNTVDFQLALGHAMSISPFLFDHFQVSSPNHIYTALVGDPESNGNEVLDIVYGPSFGPENHISAPAPNFSGGTWYVMSSEWVASDASHVIATVRLDPKSSTVAGCDDPVTGHGCAVTIIGTGAAGECPVQPDTAYLGQRYDGSGGNSTVWFGPIRYYH